MVRFNLKGGVWKNTEDEILKAAVMKYGKNQWARISSLLVRKSAKQCKARWNEWLDPSIKKTEWTREEEEKLLHLAKIMPNQWRSIAPMIGRTAAQCLEHYERLLDSAQETKADYDANDDPRKLKPGEIDPTPEARPARPDPVDMDEDEKEMLSEARARLANTKGKKAKRKAREKQLEEAKRLAQLQKRRELKAAGIDSGRHRRKRKGEIDYSTEIPFQHLPPPGLFSTAEEDRRTREIKSQPFRPVHLQELEGKSRNELEQEERKKDLKQQKLLKETNLPEAILKINALNDPTQIRRRANLNLPSPQISDGELEELARLSEASNLPAAAAHGPTKTLLSQVQQTPLPIAARTPLRTPVARDTIQHEVQNLLALSSSQTPLFGGENKALYVSDYSSATPKSSVVATPNILRNSVGATPSTKAGKTPSVRGTPLRDDLNLNNPEYMQGLSAEQALMLGKARSRKTEQQRLSNLRQKVKSSLSSLPAPQHEYAVVLPDLPREQELSSEPIEEDMEDILQRQTLEQNQVTNSQLQKRTQAVQRGLPIPSAINPSFATPSGNQVDDLINSEVLSLVRFDITHKPNKRFKSGSLLDEFSSSELAEVDSLLQSEMQNVDLPPAEMVGHLWEQAFEDFMFLPSRKQFGRLSEVSAAEQIQALTQEYTILSDRVVDFAQQADKSEKKMALILGGYQQRINTARAQYYEAFNRLQSLQIEQQCYAMLQRQEAQAIPHRTEVLRKEVALAKEKQNDLQSKFQQLTKEKQRLEQILQSVSS